jgi:hypothetical protein
MLFRGIVSDTSSGKRQIDNVATRDVTGVHDRIGIVSARLPVFARAKSVLDPSTCYEP